MTTPPQQCPILHGESFARTPETAYAELRVRGPVAEAELAPGVRCLSVTGYSAARTVLTDTGRYSKDARLWRDLNEGRVPPSYVLGLMAYRPSLLYADGARHARLREAMDDSINRISSLRLEEVTRRVALGLIGRFAPRGRADLMAAFADTVPMLVFAELLGASPQITSRLVAACQGLINAGPDAAQSSADMAASLAELIVDKQRHPGEDVTSWMLAPRAGLTPEEIAHQLVVFIGAGTIPTAAWIGYTIHSFLVSDTDAGSLAAGTTSVVRALEKILWTRSPMANFCFHYARQDHYLDGVFIPAGVPLVISLAAVNHDPALAGLPYDNRAHLAWSAGPHRCPAVNEATVIATTAVEVVFDRLYDMEIDTTDRPVNRPGPFYECPDSLHVTFRRRPATAAPTTGGTP